MKAMVYYQDAVFIGKTLILTVSYQTCFSKDAGSNIGIYTIMMATMDRRVIAVDAMVDNLVYIRRSLKFDNKKSLRYHKDVHKEEAFPCPHCDKVFHRKLNYGLYISQMQMWLCHISITCIFCNL